MTGALSRGNDRPGSLLHSSDGRSPLLVPPWQRGCYLSHPRTFVVLARRAAQVHQIGAGCLLMSI
jgi:hypothetical protein